MRAAVFQIKAPPNEPPQQMPRSKQLRTEIRILLKIRMRHLKKLAETESALMLALGELAEIERPDPVNGVKAGGVTRAATASG